MFNLIPELLVGALTQVKPLSKQSRKANFIHLHLALCFIGSFFAEPACRVPKTFCAAESLLDHRLRQLRQ